MLKSINSFQNNIFVIQIRGFLGFLSSLSYNYPLCIFLLWLIRRTIKDINYEGSCCSFIPNLGNLDGISLSWLKILNSDQISPVGQCFSMYSLHRCLENQGNLESGIPDRKSYILPLNHFLYLNLLSIYIYSSSNLNYKLI